MQALAGVSFDTRRTFVLPAGAADLRHIRQLVDREGGAKIAIFGHTDSQGPDADNDELSLLRAQALDTLLRHNVGWWIDRFALGSEIVGPGRPEIDFTPRETAESGSAGTLALRKALTKALRAKIGSTSPKLAKETAWGMLEIQHMLAALGRYEGPTTGVATPATKLAIKDFRKAEGLTSDGERRAASPATSSSRSCRERPDATVRPRSASTWPTRSAIPTRRRRSSTPTRPATRGPITSHSSSTRPDRCACARPRARCKATPTRCRSSPTISTASASRRPRRSSAATSSR